MRLSAIKSASASTASLVALYALVASCSSNMSGAGASLDGEWTPVRAHAAAPVKLAVLGEAVEVHTHCSAVRTTLSRAGRVEAEPMSPELSATVCDSDRDVMAFVHRRPELVRVDARTVELRRGRQRVRFRRA